MNTTQPLPSFPDWHPPSPRSTPQSTKFGAYQFQSPPSSEPSPSFHNGWMTPQYYQYNTSMLTPNIPPTKTMDGQTNAQSLKRPRPISYQNVVGKEQENQYTVTPGVEGTHQQGQFPSHSFIEQFHSTHLDDQALPPPPVMGPLITPLIQMQTPPPTRNKVSSRRKTQKPVLMPIETPSANGPRRMSVPEDTWLRRPGEGPITDMSPFNITPLQISPPGTMHYPMNGPMTAPAYPQSGLFWDPNTNHSASFPSFTTPTDGPFMGNEHGHGVVYTYQPQLISPPSSAPGHEFVVPALPVHGLVRPQSARPADSRPPNATTATISSHLRQASSVDPSMLWTEQIGELNPLLRPSSVQGNASIDPRQPYQYQIEALRREKEERVRKAARRQTMVDSSYVASESGDLRRTVTDSRARKTATLPHSIQTSPAPQESSVTSAQVSRTSSPVKRVKSAILDRSTTPGRKSVVLTVDDKGRAVTRIKTVNHQTLSRTHASSTSLNSLSSADSDSDSSDLPEGPLTRSSSSLGLWQAPTKAHQSLKSSPTRANDAQNALREIVRDRQRGGEPINILGGSGLLDYSHHSHVPMGPPPSLHRLESVPWNISPTTITDPDLQTPTSDRDTQYYDITRCVCNNVVNNEGQLMIQCESCMKWLHVLCLGLNPHHLPSSFHCLYCVSSAPAVRAVGRPRAHTTVPYYTPPHSQGYM